MFLFLPYLLVSMTTVLVDLKSKWLLELKFRTYWMKDTVPQHVLALVLVGGRRWCIWICLAKTTFAHPIGCLWTPQWELAEEWHIRQPVIPPFSQLVDLNTAKSVGKSWHISKELQMPLIALQTVRQEEAWSNLMWMVRPSLMAQWDPGGTSGHLQLLCMNRITHISQDITVPVPIPAATGPLRFRLLLGKTISVIRETRVRVTHSRIFIPTTHCGMGKGVAPAALAVSWTGHHGFVYSWMRLQEKIWSWGFAVTRSAPMKMFWFRMSICMLALSWLLASHTTFCLYVNSIVNM